MVFSLMAGDLYLSTKLHEQVQPRWVPNWTWNSDNDSSSSFHGLYGLVFSDQPQPKLLLIALKMSPVPNLSKSLLLWKFLCTEFEKYISSLTINNPAIFGSVVLSRGRIAQLHQLLWWILLSWASVKTLGLKRKYLLIFIWNSSQNLNRGFKCLKDSGQMCHPSASYHHNAVLTQLKSFTALQMSIWS